MRKLDSVMACLLLVVIGCTGGSTMESPPAALGAPILDGMGDFHFPVDTENTTAQRLFDQGMVLAYGFNHAEAARSFRAAARLDPSCGMCFWGVAYVLGPNINSAMDPELVPEAYAAARKAKKLAREPKEQALAEAMALRYAPEEDADRAPLDRAWSDAMRSVLEQFPEDVDAAVLLAESLMDLHPWDYWRRDGSAQPWTPEILALLESALERRPAHPGANHFYIHAVEASPHPERALPVARRLGSLAPGAGHLVHMPSHIFIRTGHYREASEANLRAIEADDSYATQCHAQGLYPLGYMPHNHHFLWAASTLEGRSQVALEAARELSGRIDTGKMRVPELATLQHYWITPLFAQVRFARWEEILVAPRPDDDLIYPVGVWEYAQAMAKIGTGDLAGAEASLSRLRALAADPALESITVWDINAASDLLAIAVDSVAGSLASARGLVEPATERLRAAVEREDALRYDEPATWHHPVRQLLGAHLMASGSAEEAEQVYREDLVRYPDNGWSLFGLAQSLDAQGRTTEAAAAKQRFERAWKRADVTLISSREPAGG